MAVCEDGHFICLWLNLFEMKLLYLCNSETLTVDFVRLFLEVSEKISPEPVKVPEIFVCLHQFKSVRTKSIFKKSV